MDPQELIQMLMAGGEGLDRRPQPTLPIAPYGGMDAPTAPSMPYPTGRAPTGFPGPLPPGRPGERLGQNPQELIQALMENPEEGDPYQVAGDVVPMRGVVRPQDTQEFNDRMGRLNADPRLGQRGMQSIEKFGGKQGPYLDLMDILMMNRR